MSDKKTKEQIHDLELAPLVAEILRVCETNKIACVISFSLDKASGLQCTSAILYDDTDPPDEYVRALDVLLDTKSRIASGTIGPHVPVKPFDS